MASARGLRGVLARACKAGEGGERRGGWTLGWCLFVCLRRRDEVFETEDGLRRKADARFT